MKNREKTNDSKSMIRNENNKKKKRLGGKGLSLEAFANAKSKNNDYNPAIIKKQREFYKNAKCISKFKKTLKQQDNHLSSTSTRPTEVYDKTGDGRKMNKGKEKKNSLQSLRESYEKKREEEEKAKIEREEANKAKQEERERAEARRKEQRKKMFKKTRSGQPVMKYRIEHLLEVIQGSRN